MLWKCKKLVGLFMIVVMCVMMFTPTASAQEMKCTESVIPSSNALFRSSGAEVPLQLSKELKNMNITVKDNTIIEYVSSRNNNVADVMVITNTNGFSMEKTFVTSMTSNGQRRIYGEWNDGAAWPATPLQDSFNLVMMVEYNRFETNIVAEYYYQPVNMIFIYYDNAQKYSSCSIEVDYRCGGYEFAINRDSGTGAIIGYTPLTSNYEQSTHSIKISKSSADRNTYYGGNNPYDTDQVIDVNRGNWACHSLSYEAVLVRKEDRKEFKLDGVMGIDQLQ